MRVTNRSHFGEINVLALARAYEQPATPFFLVVGRLNNTYAVRCPRTTRIRLLETLSPTPYQTVEGYR